MKKSLRGMVQFNSVRTQLTFWFMIIALVPLVFVGTVVYENVENSRKASMIDKLEAVRDLKVKEVNNWLDERIGDVRTIASSREIRKLEKVYEGREKDIEENRETIVEARELLKRHL
ncbi:MAG: hypothetical protein OEU95_05560, partial [Nitrospirota bacterium]|nr:hypothetical protein [Nitrospirota bacterium]